MQKKTCIIYFTISHTLYSDVTKNDKPVTATLFYTEKANQTLVSHNRTVLQYNYGKPAPEIFKLFGFNEATSKMHCQSNSKNHYYQLSHLMQAPFTLQFCNLSQLRINLLKNGRLSDRYRIGTDTGCIVLYRLLLYRPILCASLQVHQLLTGRITHDDQRAFKRPVTRPHACVLFYDPWYGRGLEGREAEGDHSVTERLVSGYKYGAVLVLATITPHSLHQQEVITMLVNCQSLLTFLRINQS